MYPVNPLVREALVFKHLQNDRVFQFIKSFFKIQLQDHNLFFGVVAEVKELKSPDQTVLDCSSFYESILVWVNQVKNDLL